MFQPLMAETERSKDQLFSQLSRAGYDHVVEIPYRNFWNTRSSHPYMVETSQSCLHNPKVSFEDLPQQRLPAMSYRKTQAVDGSFTEWMQATRIGDFLVCFKKLTRIMLTIPSPGQPIASEDFQEHEENTFRNCFIFPVEVEQVVAELENISEEGA